MYAIWLCLLLRLVCILVQVLWLLGLCACDLGLERLWLLCFVDLLLFGLVSSVDHTSVCCFLLVSVVYGAFVLVCLITCLFWFISSLVCCVVCFSDGDLVVCWRGWIWVWLCGDV